MLHFIISEDASYAGGEIHISWMISAETKAVKDTELKCASETALEVQMRIP